MYSVGDGNILVHDPKNLRDEAMVLSNMIYTANPQYNVSFHTGIFSSPEPLGSQGELIGWP